MSARKYGMRVGMYGSGRNVKQPGVSGVDPCVAPQCLPGALIGSIGQADSEVRATASARPKRCSFEGRGILCPKEEAAPLCR